MNRIKVPWMILQTIFHVVILIFGILFLIQGQNVSPYSANMIQFMEKVFAEPEITPEPASLPEPVDEPTAPENPQYTFTASHYMGNLHIRTGPSLNDPIIARIRPGDSGDVLSIGEEWSYVTFKQNGQYITGYVYNGYITLTPIDTEG